MIMFSDDIRRKQNCFDTVPYRQKPVPSESSIGQEACFVTASLSRLKTSSKKSASFLAGPDPLSITKKNSGSRSRELKTLEKPTLEAGIGLVESLVAMAILAIIAAVFLSGVATAAKADFTVSQRAMAQNLAHKQAEAIKTQDYINFTSPSHGQYDLVAATGSFTVEVLTTPINSTTGAPLTEGEDLGVQLFTVTVKRSGSVVVTLSNYKVDR